MAASNSMATNVQESMLGTPNSSRGTLNTYAESVAQFNHVRFNFDSLMSFYQPISTGITGFEPRHIF